MKDWGTCQAAIMHGGRHDGVEFGVANPYAINGHGYNTINGVAIEWYWLTGKKDVFNRWIFRAENWWWRSQRRIFAYLGYRLCERPSWAFPVRLGPQVPAHLNWKEE